MGRGMKMRRKGELEAKPVPLVSRKAFRKLKGELVKPVEARRIILDLKRIDTQEMGSQAPAQGVKRWIMPLLDDGSDSSLSTLHTSSTPTIILTAPATISPAFSTVLATANGVISNLSSSSTLTAAFDRPTIFICHSLYPTALWDVLTKFCADWWGYEIALPPPTIKVLGKAHSVSSTFFTFFTAFVIAGGAPELMPYLNYLSTFIDMEFAAIRAQDKGVSPLLFDDSGTDELCQDMEWCSLRRGSSRSLSFRAPGISPRTTKTAHSPSSILFLCSASVVVISFSHLHRSLNFEIVVLFRIRKSRSIASK